MPPLLEFLVLAVNSVRLLMIYIFENLQTGMERIIQSLRKQQQQEGVHASDRIRGEVMYR
jgi:hypothetical protein